MFLDDELETVHWKTVLSNEFLFKKVKEICRDSSIHPYKYLRKVDEFSKRNRIVKILRNIENGEIDQKTMNDLIEFYVLKISLSDWALSYLKSENLGSYIQELERKDFEVLQERKDILNKSLGRFDISQITPSVELEVKRIAREENDLSLKEKFYEISRVVRLEVYSKREKLIEVENVIGIYLVGIRYSLFVYPFKVLDEAFERHINKCVLRIKDEFINYFLNKS